MRIAILGTRGVPPNYGGFETFAAELGTRLVERGHSVTVYCRRLTTADLQPPTANSSWRGIERIELPALRHKYLETVSHTFLSALDALRRDFDVVLLCNAANAFVLPLLRAARLPVAINVDGIERKRRKWNILGRAVYTAGEAFSVSFASRVVADADVIADYYRENYAASTVTIPYGADFPVEEDSDVLQRLGLEPRNYILYVSRFEPENNPLEVVKAYEALLKESAEFRVPSASSLALASGAGTGHSALGTVPLPPLVMLGKGLYAHDLVAELHRHASDHVLFPGALYGADYRTLQRNALLYVQATEVGGTHPAMIEAMASGGAVLAYGTPENREVGGDAVGYFDFGTLPATLSEWLINPLIREEMRSRARERAGRLYSWERVTDAYEELFRRVT